MVMLCSDHLDFTYLADQFGMSVLNNSQVMPKIMVFLLATGKTMTQRMAQAPIMVKTRHIQMNEGPQVCFIDFTSFLYTRLQGMNSCIQPSAGNPCIFN